MPREVHIAVEHSKPEIRNRSKIWSKNNIDFNGKTNIRARRQHIFITEKKTSLLKWPVTSSTQSEDAFRLNNLKSADAIWKIFLYWNICNRAKSELPANIIDTLCALQFHFRSTNFKFPRYLVQLTLHHNKPVYTVIELCSHFLSWIVSTLLSTGMNMALCSSPKNTTKLKIPSWKVCLLGPLPAPILCQPGCKQERNMVTWTRIA